jgi:predicted Zn-dependent peptidase
VKSEKISESELQKVKNKTESQMAFEDMSLMNRANSLAFYELLGDASLINHELDRYNKVTADDIRSLSKEIFREENSSTLYYYAGN